MTEVQKSREGVVAKDRPRLRYPNNSLRPQVREFKDTLSAFTVIKNAADAEK